MIYFCPACGCKLGRPIRDGITTCINCNHVFDTCDYNKTLSASWMVRRWNIFDPEIIKEKCDLSEKDMEIIDFYIIQSGYVHDEFIKMLNSKLCP